MAVTGAGLEGIIAAESQICYIDGDAGILSYRDLTSTRWPKTPRLKRSSSSCGTGVLPKQAELDALKKDLVAHRAIPAEVTAFLKQVRQVRAHGRAAHRRLHAVAVRSAGQGHVARSQRDQGRQADVADRDHRHHIRPSAQRQGGGRGRSEARVSRRISSTP